MALLWHGIILHCVYVVRHGLYGDYVNLNFAACFPLTKATEVNIPLVNKCV